MPATTSNLHYSPHVTLDDGLGVRLAASHYDLSSTQQDPKTNHPTSHKLGALHPMPMRPCGVVKPRVPAVLALQRIEAIEVSASQQRMGGVEYCVDIYYRDQRSRIPIHGPYGLSRLASATHPHADQPSFTLQLAYEDFVQLSHGACELARLSHRSVCCPFCRPIVLLNTTSPLKPRWNTHWFKSDRQVCEMLTMYLNEMLQLTMDGAVSGVDLCHAQQRVPRLLRSFLRPRMDERESV